MRTIILSLFVVCIAISSSSAQKTASISGALQDSTHNPLVGASAILYYQADSLYAGYALTDSLGKFVIPNVGASNYYLSLSYIGFQSQSISLNKEQFAQEIDLGLIRLKNANAIDGVVIHSAPLEIRQDTIIYDATMFATPQTETVEDLLKKLPGVEVDSQGNIKAQGEEVKNVLVDGKKFFGDDVKIATKNLPAEAVQNVEVYDKKSEKAEFTGVDDGETQKTINLDLKDDYKAGVFGNIKAGAGSDDRYIGKATLNRFTPEMQLSFIGSRNNINQQAFGIMDYLSMQGGFASGSSVMISGDLGRSFRQEEGINTSTSIGSNMNYTPSEKMEINASYFFDETQNRFDIQTDRQEILPTTQLNSTESRNGNNQQQNHRIELDGTYTINKRTEFTLENSLSFGNNENQKQLSGETIELEQITNQNLSTQQTIGDQSKVQSNLFFKHSLKKTGRSIFADAGFVYNASEQDFYNQSNTNLFSPQQEINLNQMQENAGNQSTINASLSYTEPIAENQFLEIGFKHTKQNGESILDFYDIEGNEKVFNASLSNTFHREYQTNTPSLRYRFTKNKHNINIGIQHETSNLKGDTQLSNNAVNATFKQLLPSLNWKININKGKHISLNYRSSLNAPSIQQLQPVVNNTNPLNIYMGNPNLQAEIAHNARLNWFSFDRFSMTNILASINLRQTNHKIVNAQTFDENNLRTTTPQNSDRQLLSSANIHFSKPIRSIRTRVKAAVNTSYTSGETFINSQNTDFTTFNHGYHLSLSNTNTNKVDVSAGGRWDFNNQYYQQNESLNQQFLNQSYDFSAAYVAKELYTFQTSLTQNIFSKEQFGANNSFTYWSAYVQRQFMKKKATIRLQITDILNQNQGISRVNEGLFVQEQISNVLGRYGMLSLQYNIKPKSQKKTAE